MKNKMLYSLFLTCLIPVAANAVDQCNTTAECKNKFGSTATDCKNSKADNSVCMCGAQVCDTGTPSSVAASSVSPSSTPTSSTSSSSSSQASTGSGMLGKFNKSRDILLAFHDNKPDNDDIHSQAAIGTMLRDPRFNGVNAFAVQGTIGIQDGPQLTSNSLFDMIYGSNWANAIGSGRTSALNATTSRAISALDAGGDIWIVEAGQSDFSADLVRNIKSQRASVNTKTRVHIVQHSKWNEDKTTASDLSYVKNNTNYVKIGDGNTGAGTSPALRSDKNNSTHWNRALSMPNPTDDYWREARRIANLGGWSPIIRAGGIDFSDTAEALWIFELNDEVKAASDDIMGFFAEFD